MEENETTKLTRMPATNSGFALWGLTCFVETFVRGLTFVLRMNSSAKNPHNAKPCPLAVILKTDTVK
jgi:hypothetical protein